MAFSQCFKCTKVGRPITPRSDSISGIAVARALSVFEVAYLGFLSPPINTVSKTSPCGARPLKILDGNKTPNIVRFQILEQANQSHLEGD